MNMVVFGAGAWGTAMAIHLLRVGNSVTLAPRRIEHALELSSCRENRDYLPGHPLAADLQIGCEPAPLLLEAELVILACPSHGLRGLCRQLQPVLIKSGSLGLVITLCKGLEKDSWMRPGEIVAELLPGIPHAALSGPTYAGEVAEEKPTAVVLAGDCGSDTLKHAQQAIAGHNLRVYISDDCTGVELGGALKNVYAIGAGICAGLGLGDNAKAAYLTRALHEMVTLGMALGGRAETFYGLGGFGDLIATCNGSWSRNRGFGEALAKGKTSTELLSGRRTAVEGHGATLCFHALCQQMRLEAPILHQLFCVIDRQITPEEGIRNLMTRPLKAENGNCVINS